MEKELRQEACKLLEEGTVDYIIGFAPGSLKFTTTPLITEDIDEINNLVINPFINNNLAKYLLEISGRVGIIAKGCDSRSIVSLIQDKQIARQDVVILGIPCSGLIDLKKVEKLTGKERDEIDDIVVVADKVCHNCRRREKGVSRQRTFYSIIALDVSYKFLKNMISSSRSRLPKFVIMR